MWITGEQARRDVQRLRARSCAVMTGSGTVLADDPSLTVREAELLGRQPLRVVLDRRLQIPATARLFAEPGRVMVFTKNHDRQRREELAGKGADVIVLEEAEFSTHVLRYLAEKEEINEVLVEAGPRLSGSLIREGLVDELVLYQASVILGDRAKGMFALPQLETMEERLRLTQVDVRKVGEDTRFVYRFDTNGYGSAD